MHSRRDRLHIPVFSGFPGGSAGKESSCNVGELGSIPGLGTSPGEGGTVLLPGEFYGQRNLVGYCPWGCKEWDSMERLSLGSFPGGLDGKESDCNVGDPGSIPAFGRGGGNGNSLQDSCLENPMDSGAWRATVHRVSKSQI